MGHTPVYLEEDGTLLVTFIICFYFWRWGRKFVIKKVPILAGWER